MGANIPPIRKTSIAPMLPPTPRKRGDSDDDRRRAESQRRWDDLWAAGAFVVGLDTGHDPDISGHSNEN